MVHARTRLKQVLGIFLLLLFAICALFIYTKIRKKNEERVLVVYTAIFEVDNETAASLRVGERLIDAKGKEDAGEILRITREETLFEDVFGAYPLPHRVTLALTLWGDGVRKAGDVRIGTLTPKAGEALYLLGSAKLEGLCVKVRAS